MIKPYFQDENSVIFHGDCREILPEISAVECIVTDPPYGDTDLDWDSPAAGWIDLLPSSILWCFGSFRFWMSEGKHFSNSWKLAQEIVWEKHNGSSFHADRFKRVHELIVQWYRGKWEEKYHDTPVTKDATSRTVRRKERPQHMRKIGGAVYTSEDGGPRLMRSVQRVRSCHGFAVHPTQKPLEILRPLIFYSSPKGGTVLDPFCGSGSTLVAAKEISRKAIGIEKEEKFCEEAAKRLRQEVIVV